jgi:hypothetical protein
VWVNPIVGRHEITARFGEAGSNWANRHTGLDLAASCGTDVVAVDNGLVLFAGWGGTAYGNIVKIRHSGVDSWYAHLSRISVTVFQRVTQGQKIGEVGETGNATGCHVHLEARVAGAAVDPAKYLSGNVTTVATDGDGGSNIPIIGDALDTIGNIRDAITFVTDPQNWVRVALFFGGGVLILLALYLNFQSQATKLIRQVLSP